MQANSNVTVNRLSSDPLNIETVGRKGKKSKKLNISKTKRAF